MRNNLIPILFIVFMTVVSCKEEPQGAYDPVTNTDTEYFPAEADIDPENPNSKEKQNRDEDHNFPDSKDNFEELESSEKTGSTDISGVYIKSGEESDNNCGCYCLDINFNSGSEICLVKDDIYVNTRFQKNSDNTVQVFLVSPSNRNKENDVPFEKFDTDTPIATISRLPKGELKLDWLGFKSNGDLVADYAIYGKKTLEGTYRKK